MERKCVICGKPFKCSPSDKTITCGKECSKIRKSLSHRGKSNRWSADAKKRLSDTGQTENLKLGTAAAKISPNSGRFETNVNAIDWHIVSPEGKHYQFRSLANWARNNYQLFGFTSESEAYKIMAGIQQAKRGTQGKPKACSCTYKGWSVVLDSPEQ